MARPRSPSPLADAKAHSSSEISGGSYWAPLGRAAETSLGGDRTNCPTVVKPLDGESCCLPRDFHPAN